MRTQPPQSSQDTPHPDAAGGRAHFLQVFLSQRSQMEALVSRRVGCRATAADLVQDLFLRFWRRPLVQVEELSTYLLRCAGNIAIDHLRSEGARVRGEGLRIRRREVVVRAGLQALDAVAARNPSAIAHDGQVHHVGANID